MAGLEEYAIGGAIGLVVGAVIAAYVYSNRIVEMTAKGLCSTVGYADLQTLHGKCPNVTPLDIANWYGNNKNW